MGLFHLKNKRQFIALCIFICFAEIAVSYTSAEDISIHGVRMHVDVLRSTGAGYTTVGVGSHQELVEDRNIQNFVAQAYFSDRELFRLLDTKQIRTFVSDSVQQHELPITIQALGALFEFGDSSSQDSVDLFEDLSSKTDAVNIFTPLLSKASLESVSPRIISICLVTIGKSSIETVREHFTRLLYAHTDALRTYLREKLLDCLHVGNVQDAEQYTTLMKEFFSADDPEVKSFQVLIVKLHELVQGGNEVETTLSDLSSSDPILKRYLAPLVMETIHKKAKEYLAVNQSEKALQILSQVDQEKRTPLTHSLTVDSLKALPPNSRIFFDVQRVGDFIEKVSSNDPFVREAYFNLLERILKDRVSLDMITDGQEVLKLVTRIRPDPNTLNDGFRIEAAIILLKSDKKQDAKIFLDDVKTGIPILSRLRIIGIKMYIQRVLVCIVLVGLIGIFFALRFLPSLATILFPPPKDGDEPSLQEEELERSRPVFVSSRGRVGGVPHEYLEVLYELGLDGSATLKDIKTAYRNKIKDIHPDHQLNESSDNAEFLRVKDVYERALEIRKRLGLD